MNSWVMAWLSVGIAWIATGVAVSVGIYYTKDASCLWVLIFPLFIGIKSSGSNSSDKNIKEKVE